MKKGAKLIVGLLARSQGFLQNGISYLEQTFGKVQLQSPVIPWNFSDYYQEELGPNLIRAWVAFSDLCPPDGLKEFKKKTIALEEQLKDKEGKRPVNLDPGVLTLHNLVLATTKDYTHRIYLGDGIYAEVTLIYKQGRFQTLPWTYLDYRIPECLNFLTACRNELISALQHQPGDDLKPHNDRLHI